MLILFLIGILLLMGYTFYKQFKSNDFKRVRSMLFIYGVISFLIAYICDYVMMGEFKILLISMGFMLILSGVMSSFIFKKFYEDI